MTTVSKIREATRELIEGKFGGKSFSVFPCGGDDGKKPLTEHGFKDAVKKLDLMISIWKKDANIGLPTGEENGLLVIDIDDKDWKGKCGSETIKELEGKLGDLPHSWVALTPSGGRHLYFSYPGGCTVKSDIEGLGNGVDIRANGGYVIAPPSYSPIYQKSYEWDAGSHPEDIPLQPLPPAWVKYILECQQGTEPAGTERVTVPERIKDGERNTRLFKIACSMRAKKFPESAIKAALFETNKEICAPPLLEKEVETILKSALKYEPGGEDKSKKQPPPAAPVEFRKLKSARELMKKDIPEPVVFVGVGAKIPLLLEGTCILSAKPKLGKSWLALELCLRVAYGEDFLGYHTKKSGVLYLDLETSEGIQKKRLAAALKGRELPEHFYLDTATPTLDGGFCQQVERYLEEDPAIAIVIVDVFQYIRTEAQSLKESDYAHAYRDITPLNELAQKHHISIILVSHDRKSVDPEDPFANILGSTGLQGAVTQMICMYRRRKNDPIHLAVRGKTIDGNPELDIVLEDATWKVVSAIGADIEAEKARKEFFESPIRVAALGLARKGTWEGRSRKFIQDAVELCDVGIEDNPRDIGLFFHKYQGMFLSQDSLKLSIINNGSGGKRYKIQFATVDGEEEKEGLTVDDFAPLKEEEIPFSI